MFDLLVTTRQLDIAKDNKAVGYLYLDPLDFLALTVNGAVSSWIESEERQEAQAFRALAEYNEWSRQGKILCMPYLSIDTDTGKVLDHEGRHRAVACDRAKKKIPVAIDLRINGRKAYYVQPFIDNLQHPRMYAKRFLGINEVPTRLLGQFSSTSVSILRAKESWVPFYSKEETEVARLRSTGTTKLVRLGQNKNVGQKA